MKKLIIQAENCLVSKNGCGDVRINDKDINVIIRDNLPEMPEYKDFPARVSISIELMDTDLNIEKEGYPNIEAVPEKEAF